MKLFRRTPVQALGRSAARWRQRDGAGQPVSSSRAVEPLLDDQLLTRLNQLVVQSRQLTWTGLSGEHRSRRKGLSPEFSDFKPYSHGDDFRRIDWKTYARFDELFIRESETTTELNVHLLIDVSRSMDWRSDPALLTKLRYALRLSGALGYLSLWHFDRLTVSAISAVNGPVFGPAQGRANIVPLVRFLEQLTPRPETSLPGFLGNYVYRSRRPGLLLIASDFLSDEPDELGDVVRRAVGRGWQVVLLHVQDPAEVDPRSYVADDVVIELFELEAGGRLRVQGDAGTLTTYREQRAAWLESLMQVAAQPGVILVPVETDMPVDVFILNQLRAREVVL